MSDTVLSEMIELKAAKAQQVVVDGESVTQHPLHELIEADKYLEANRAASRGGFGMRFQKIIPPGGG